MKLSKFYSDKSDLFVPIEFNAGSNIVLAEIRLPENRAKDTHNLGKTTLGRLIDFGFLADRDAKFFLFKHLDLFRGFTFFLEIELADQSYVTVRRSVSEASKIALKTHAGRHQDFTSLSPSGWDHVNVPFDRARELLDGILDWRDVKPWPYRKGLGYLIRSQDDFRDVFQLRKFANAHADWKPFLAHILGFNAVNIAEHYAMEDALSKRQSDYATIGRELGGSVEDASKIEGMLLLKQREVDSKQKLLDAFDFRTQDKVYTRQLVDDVDAEIASLNDRRYSLNQNRKKITASLEEDQILFDPEEAERLFRESQVLFAGQIKRDFEQLIAFNKAISEERRGYLQEERNSIDAELKEISSSLNALGRRRSEMLLFLTGTDAFGKYKRISSDLVGLRVDIATLERQREYLHRLQELRTEIRTLRDKKNHVQTLIERDVEEQNSNKESLFSTIRLFFNEIVEEVIDRKALLSVSPNQYGHLEFKAEILDESGSATSADMGHTYRKLLCMAFDLAVVRAHLDGRFARFVFHDGAFESLDDRKKQNLAAVIRRYTEIGIQSVVTVIDSDLPNYDEDTQPLFDEADVVSLLHDEDDRGRLFRMPSW